MISKRGRDVLYTRRVSHSKSVTNLRRHTRLHLVFKTFLRCPADVSFADKRLKHVSQTLRHQNLQKTSSSPKRMVHWETLCPSRVLVEESQGNFVESGEFGKSQGILFQLVIFFNVIDYCSIVQGSQSLDKVCYRTLG